MKPTSFCNADLCWIQSSIITVTKETEAMQTHKTRMKLIGVDAVSIPTEVKINWLDSGTPVDDP